MLRHWLLIPLGVTDVFADVFFTLLLLGCAYLYVALIRQIRARPANELDAPRRFGLPEAVLASALAGFLVLGVVSSASNSNPPAGLNDKVLIGNLFFIVGIVVVVAAFLRLRGFDLATAAGFGKVSFLRALSIAIVLLLAAYPLIAFAELMTQRFLGSGSSRQSIVELFSGSSTINQRVMIIFFAVAVAPVTEEFLFRFFIYGVLRRYFGRFFGVVSNSLLFAAVHAHVPSFAPLFVLATCFTLAYEWSGSILVSMSMHALFNSVSLVALAFPDLFPQ
jgi:membrane protease YdiL (CAAX protease family)